MIRKLNKLFVSKWRGRLTLIFLILLSFSFYNHLFLCKFFPRDTFDSQLAIFWDYTSLYSLIPNIDIMYPYGLLSYYKNTSLFFFFIYVLLFPSLGILILSALEKIIKNKVLIYPAFFSFILFVLRYTGLEVFNRYGLLLGISILLSLVYAKHTYIPRTLSIIFGCLIGFIFSIINDVGFYCIIFFLFFSLFIPIFNNGVDLLKTNKYYIYQAHNIILFLIGILIGLLPAVFFFIKLENLATLFYNSKYLFDFPIYSKTPFLPSLRSTENLFNFTALTVTIFVLSYKRIILKEKNTLLSYVQVGIVISLLLLLQKSVIRSIDTQITFLSFLLYIFLILEVINFLKGKVGSVLLYTYFASFLFLAFYVIGLREFNVTNVYSYKLVGSDVITGNIKSFLTRKQASCFSQNIGVYRENKTYRDILTFIKNNVQSRPIIFDYLTNPIFYVLSDQKSPFYFEVFASSPSYAQQRINKEIGELDTDFVILNADTLRTKDNVPDYARNSILLKYILNNFEVLEKVENFIIFKKTEDENFDFFADKNLAKVTDFKNYLLNVDLGSIPGSEGLYKSKLLGNKVIDPKDFAAEDKIIVLRSKSSTKNKKLLITLSSNFGNTRIEFDNCIKDNLCIINLSNVPFFYKNRIIKEIRYDPAFIEDMKVLQGLPDGIY